jgi:hypothetical protein
MSEAVKKFTYETFEPLVGEEFWFDHPEEEAFPVVLTSVDLSPHEVPDDDAYKQSDRKPFSLLFHAEGHHHVDQETVDVKHAQLGNFDLFVVPHGPDARGMTYGAVFS